MKSLIIGSDSTVETKAYNSIYLVQAALFYYAFAQLGFLFAYPGTNIAFLWLPAGGAMAAIVFYGPKAAIGIFTGALLANYFALQPDPAELQLSFAILTAAGNTFSGLIAGLAYLRYISATKNSIQFA